MKRYACFVCTFKRKVVQQNHEHVNDVVVKEKQSLFDYYVQPSKVLHKYIVKYLDKQIRDVNRHFNAAYAGAAILGLCIGFGFYRLLF